MNIGALPRRRPVPTATTTTFVVALAATVAYFAGLVPGVPKTLSTFTDLLRVTGALFALAAVSWAVSLASNPDIR